MKKPNWSRKLTRVLRTTDGVELRTLHDAASFASNSRLVNRNLQLRPRWQDAAGALMEAASGGSVKAATDHVENALIEDRKLAPAGTGSRPGPRKSGIRRPGAAVKPAR